MSIKLNLIIFLILIVGSQKSIDSKRNETISRIIRLPLTKKITEGLGEFGQPVINYYTSISIGTPPKQYFIQFDVGYCESFVPFYLADPSQIRLHFNKGFNCNKSTSCNDAKLDILFWYQHCQLEGYKFNDLLKFNNATYYNGNCSSSLVPLPPARQDFVAIYYAMDDRFKDLPIDGVLHLGPSSNKTTANNSQPDSLIVGLKKANLVDKLQFSFWFNGSLSANNEEKCLLLIGDIDKTLFKGQITWHKIRNIGSLSDDMWALDMLRIELDDQQVNSCIGNDCKVFLTTGLADILGPLSDVKQIYASLNTTHDEHSGLETIECDRVLTMAKLTFMINENVSYDISPVDYTKRTAKGICYVSIFPSDLYREKWTLGSNFLSKYYTIFDMENKKVGFAEPRLK